MEVRDWGFEGGNLCFRGRLRCPSSAASGRVREFADSRGLTAFLSRDPLGACFRFQPAPRRRPSGRGHTQLLLLALTLVSTFLAGTLLSGVPARAIMSNPRLILGGANFALPLLLILGAHELGHYLAARRWGIRASLPYFIPFPNILGTMGALIAIRDHFPSRRALLDVGLAGPLVGFVLSVAVILLGREDIRMVRFDPALSAEGAGNLYFGSSLLTSFLFSLGKAPLPSGYTYSLGPLAFAGWVGLFVTSINLLPLGQLDGGHIAYAALGRGHGRLSGVAGICIFLVGVFMRSPVWMFMLIMVVFLGVRHAPPLDDLTGLNPLRRVLAVLALIIFIICFIPVPISFLGE